MRVAAIQLNSGSDAEANLDAATRLLRRAAGAGAEFAVLPEKWLCLGSAEALAGSAEALDGPSLTAIAGLAGNLGLAVVAGSIVERHGDHLHNTSVLFDREGRHVAAYRKIHMFDVEVEGTAYRESDLERAGTEPVLAPLGDRRVGLTVCYDLRFPELYRELAVAGAELITCPAAFTAATGRDHWEVLVRARAIENQLFVVAAGQYGTAEPHYRSYGRSMIVDPWGTVLATAPDVAETVVVADLDFCRMAELRERFPSLANRRPGAYRAPGITTAQAVVA
ncbi:MAG: carbon-nitrogen hydrolase family protein [Solirubrobacterales bacterium]